FYLDQERWLPAHCSHPRVGVMINAFPFEVIWIFDPGVAGIVTSLQKTSQFFFREITLVHASITFGNAQMLEKLNQNKVIAGLLLVGGHAAFVRGPCFDRLSTKLLDCLFVVANVSEQLRGKHHR